MMSTEATEPREELASAPAADRRRSALRLAWVAAVLMTCLTSGLAPLPAAAAEPTTPPYAGSDTLERCDPATVSCRTTVVADHASGRLAVDLSAVGGATYKAGAGCGQVWPQSLTCGVVRHGAYGQAWLWAYQSIPRPVAAAAFNVTVETGMASASAESAYAVLGAEAMDESGRCSDCSAHRQEVLVSASSGPSAPATRTITLTYRSASGAMIPAGPVRILVYVTGDARGVGQNELHASATVTAINATIQD